MIVRLALGILCLTVLAACSSAPTPPDIVQQLQNGGYTLLSDEPPREDSDVRVQQWKHGEHLTIEIVKFGPNDSYEIESIRDPKLEDDKQHAFSCSASNKTDVSSSVSSFEEAKKKLPAAKKVPISEESDMFKVDISPGDCLLVPAVK